MEQRLLDGFLDGSEKLSKLCQKLYLDEFENLWVFQRFTDVEPTNNLAERDLRKIVLWRKKSYGTRSERGQKFVERITSVAETVKKAGQSVIGFLRKAIKFRYEEVAAPYICKPSGY